MRHADISDVALAAARAAQGKVKVASPAFVLESDGRVARIQIVQAYRVADPETGQEIHRVRPPVPGVPVLWTGETWPLQEGAFGLAVYCDRSTDEWRATGQRQTSPRDPRRFDISDAIFIPGLYSPADPLPAEALAEGAVVVWDRGLGEVRLGGAGAEDFVALASKVLAELNALRADIRTAADAAVLAATPNDGGVAAFGAFGGAIPAASSSVAASKVKAE